ncbi:hypothetical protein [Arthrobacter caoxuetaonis]|uniref:Uncharacterized protein n=1 Tax=Arthrobacter caoxuetaonis TaxID=2886935 RepID=A0A9X1SDL6_9MICC|nr:hypothetical protein [Arthrobacter caoxuetaonis]MCC3299800.1 hypothetical protein [Arthrobacter caoxuetaonis]USQ59300.1 hypothetical protein NF551_17090 [Arthrobacter caoxuetaonis]
MDKTFVGVREDGTTYLSGVRREYPVSGDSLVLFGWKAKSRLLDRATKVFVESPELVSRAAAALGIETGPGMEYDSWAVAGQVHAVLPGGVPAFVASGGAEYPKAA